MKNKMKISALGAFLLSALLMISSCSNDDNSSTVDPEKKFERPTSAQFKAFQKEHLQRLEQKFNTVVEDNLQFEFISKGGVTVNISSMEIEDHVSIEIGDKIECTFIELYDKGNMALSNRPTMGIKPIKNEWGNFEFEKDAYGRITTKGKKEFIVTGGEFYLDVKVNGARVKNYKISMDVPTKNTNGFQKDMLLWQGNVDENNDLTFNEIPTETEIGWMGELNEDNYMLYLNGYDNLVSEIGWFNIDKYLVYGDEVTKLFVQAPEGYSYLNSAVYMAIKDNEGLGKFDSHEKDPKLGNVFTVSTDWIPVGVEAHLVFISIDPITAKIIYAIQKIKVEKNGIIKINEKELKSGTGEQFVEEINKLK